jgi:membrane protease YdiL (CAAX protease family)
MWLSLAMTFASLFALAWAGIRGLRWSEFAEAAGLRWKGGAIRFCWMSATSYACALPCMGAGVLVGLALSALIPGRSFQDVSHPVQEMLPGASGGELMALFAIACVAAPVVEEIAFRGLLFGHARQGTWRWPKALSIAFAMLFSATIFAAIHPQGVLAVPALAGVSLGFCITREWSGSVYPGMVAHGVHNGVLLSLNLVLQP